MEIAFYILLVSWVILLVTCIVAISRFKKANDSLDTSLDTVIDLNEEIQNLWNQLNDAENDRDTLKHECEKLQKTIDILNKRIGDMKATEEDRSIMYADKGHIEYVTAVTNVSNQLIKDITDGNLSVDQVEISLRNNIERYIIKNLLSYAKYYAEYDIEFNSYSFIVRIPVVIKDGSKKEYDVSSRTPLTNILLEKVHTDKDFIFRKE